MKWSIKLPKLLVIFSFMFILSGCGVETGDSIVTLQQMINNKSRAGLSSSHNVGANALITPYDAKLVNSDSWSTSSNPELDFITPTEPSTEP